MYIGLSKHQATITFISLIILHIRHKNIKNGRLTISCGDGQVKEADIKLN